MIQPSLEKNVQPSCTSVVLSYKNINANNSKVKKQSKAIKHLHTVCSITQYDKLQIHRTHAGPQAHDRSKCMCVLQTPQFPSGVLTSLKMH